MKILLGFALIVTVMAVGPASARSGFADEPLNAAYHIRNLRDEIKKEVGKRAVECGADPAARHYFSVSLEEAGAEFLSLHYEKLECANRKAVCGPQACLHEVYVRAFTGQRWHLAFRGFAEETTLSNENSEVCLEARLGEKFKRYLWKHHSFSPVSSCDAK